LSTDTRKILAHAIATAVADASTSSDTVLTQIDTTLINMPASDWHRESSLPAITVGVTQLIRLSSESQLRSVRKQAMPLLCSLSLWNLSAGECALSQRR
jgi:hypothetical protein